MLALVIVGALVTTYGVVALLADTLGNFLFALAVLSVGLVLLYAGQRVSRKLRQREEGGG